MDTSPAGLVRHRTLLPATPPYSLGASLRALTGFAPCAGDQTVAGDRVRKALVRPGRPGRAVVVDVAATPDASGVTLTVLADEPLPATAIAEVETAVSRWLGLDDDLEPFLAIARRDPAMAPVLTATAGLHHVRFASWAEAVVYFTLTQRSTQWYAAARKRHIAAAFGPRLTVDGVEHVAFPDLAALAGVDLTSLAGNRQRGDRLREVIEGVSRLNVEWLRTAPYPEARDALLAVRGVGGFTANALLLRALGRPDEVPLEMAQFARTAQAVYGDPPPTATQLRERYGNYIGWWSYLCRTGLGWLEQGSCARPAAA